MSDAPLLEVDDLRVEFTTDDGIVTAVDGISFTVEDHEVLGVVGESGSGKTVTALAILGLLPKKTTVTGSAKWRGRELIGLGDKELQPLRGEEIAIVFQDALASFNPVFTIGSQIGEAIEVHHEIASKDRDERVVELLDLVGIPNPRQRADQYPHEFSGGMRQRAMIAMALANDPALLIADEPTTALDVTLQAQVLEVLERIQARTRSSIMLITHDLGVVAGIADRIAVMYAGRHIETGPVDQIFYEPRHPYTLGLLASLPRLDRKTHGQKLYRITGQPPSLIERPPGCTFHPRCEFARLPEPCATVVPALEEVDPSHRAACHFSEGLVGLTPERLREGQRA
ncbi:MAG: ABC transporter ATP-binding protein [Actinobacteria bacterium]|nr:ABC transporter ATP-binding protein [Actinomycetota bacterium]